MQWFVDVLKSNGSDVAALFAVVVSLLALYYTRINFKTEKYIETITNQRIKWIDVLRNDIAEILTGLYIIHSSNQAINSYNKFTENEVFDNREEEWDASEFNRRNLEVKKYAENHANLIRLVAKIDSCILKLNMNNDGDFISVLKNAKDMLWKFNEYNSSLENIQSRLQIEAAKVLKNEWEKVKLEVIKGRLVSDGAKEHWYVP